MGKCPYLDYLSKPYDFQGDDEPLHSRCNITGRHCDDYFGTHCPRLEKKVERVMKRINFDKKD